MKHPRLADALDLLERVSWALRSIGRRNAALRARSVALARRLAACDDPAARWIGKDGLRELTR